jgi:hypothetical protein
LDYIDTSSSSVADIDAEPDARVHVFHHLQCILRSREELIPGNGFCSSISYSRFTLDMHMKDLHSLSDKDSQCRVGEGAMPVVAIFRQLKKMKYQGMVNLEYEIEEQNPLPGMIQSFAYMRGVVDALRG